MPAGRPKIDNPKTEKIIFCCTKEQAEKLKKEAKQADMTKSVYVAYKLFGEVKK